MWHNAICLISIIVPFVNARNVGYTTFRFHSCCFLIPPLSFTPSFVLDERLLSGRTSAVRPQSSLWLACRGSQLCPLGPPWDFPFLHTQAVLCRWLVGVQRSCWRKAAGTLSWLPCLYPASASVWSSSQLWGGPPAAACNSLCECCLSPIASSCTEVLFPAPRLASRRCSSPSSTGRSPADHSRSSPGNSLPCLHSASWEKWGEGNSY